MTVQQIGPHIIRPNTAPSAVWREREPTAGESTAEKDRLSERLDRIGARIASGFYDDPSVALEVARRVLASGDLWTPST